MGHLSAGDLARLIFSSRSSLAGADISTIIASAAPAASSAEEVRHAR